jgi:hypothetical protein
MREREAWQSEGLRFAHVAVRQSHINPWIGSAWYTLRRMCWILPEALVGLRNSPPLSGETSLLI